MIVPGNVECFFVFTVVHFCTIEATNVKKNHCPLLHRTIAARQKAEEAEHGFEKPEAVHLAPPGRYGHYPIFGALLLAETEKIGEGTLNVS
jgi:hypothetical protein